MAAVTWWPSGVMGTMGNAHEWWGTRLASGRRWKTKIQEHGLQVPPGFSSYWGEPLLACFLICKIGM